MHPRASTSFYSVASQQSATNAQLQLLPSGLSDAHAPLWAPSLSQAEIHAAVTHWLTHTAGWPSLLRHSPRDLVEGSRARRNQEQ